jgi:PAS domain-containing protein
MAQHDGAGHHDPEAGIFTWVLAEDLVYGDTSVAAHFGLDPDQTTKGLPIGAYLENVHEVDRPALAKAIAEAVKNGDPYHAEYRVKNALGAYRRVMAMGRCFRDGLGNPTIYSGIIYPLDLL